MSTKDRSAYDGLTDHYGRTPRPVPKHGWRTKGPASEVTTIAPAPDLWATATGLCGEDQHVVIESDTVVWVRNGKALR